MAIFKDEGQEALVKDHLRALATNMEVLNQRLASSTMGGDPVLKKKISLVLYQLNYLDGVVKGLEKDVDTRIKEGFSKITGYFSAVEKRIEVIGQLAGQIYMINQASMDRIQAHIEALEKVAGGNKEIWKKLNDLKQDISSMAAKNEQGFKVLKEEKSSVKYSKEEYDMKLKHLTNIIDETDKLIKGVKDTNKGAVDEMDDMLRKMKKTQKKK
jgi:chromosome segregation ATPase